MRDKPKTISSFRITPVNTGLESLSPYEIDALFAESQAGIQELLERCALAVLNAGEETDDVKQMLNTYSDFGLEVIKTSGGIELELKNVPIDAFVTYAQPSGSEQTLVSKIIEGIRQNLFAVVRDLVFIKSEIERTLKFDLNSPEGITDAVFLILRNAGVLAKTGRHKAIVCWGGHAIEREEYVYTKQVGYQCGLRFMDVITGCGPGAMKGPMKGATIAHSKQRIQDGRYIGITEPGIIASEAPNPIVDPLVIMPDIETRLEAFVRLGHGIVIFPGGAGTAEELMYILGILSHPNNVKLPFPIILTGPKSSRNYFDALDEFVRATLGEEITCRYKIILGDPIRVAQEMNRGLLSVKAFREKNNDSYYFNRRLFIPPIFQEHFVPSHESVNEVMVDKENETYLFAASLRQVFSSVVWANVKPEGVAAIDTLGPLKITGDLQIMEQVDNLLSAFVKQRRMRLVGEYKPVYEILK
ncbi:MAG: LOG family protein [Proteobacteria bacterium]|nr:LOG family protein [Pseudomonadota bacterium]